MAGFGKRTGDGPAPVAPRAVSQPAPQADPAAFDPSVSLLGPRPKAAAPQMSAPASSGGKGKGLIVSIALTVAVAGGGAVAASYLFPSRTANATAETVTQQIDREVGRYKGLGEVITIFKTRYPQAYGQFAEQAARAVRRRDQNGVSRAAFDMTNDILVQEAAHIEHADGPAMVKWLSTGVDLMEAVNQRSPATCQAAMGRVIDNTALGSDPRVIELASRNMVALFDVVESGKRSPNRRHERPTSADSAELVRTATQTGLSEREMMAAFMGGPPGQKPSCAMMVRLLRALVRMPEPGRTRIVAQAVKSAAAQFR
jgi:hypothetical protein